MVSLGNNWSREVPLFHARQKVKAHFTVNLTKCLLIIYVFEDKSTK